MATSKTILKRNVPSEKLEGSKEWIRNNPRLARMEEDELDYYEIDVFASWTHDKVADDLHQALLDSGFLEKYPLYRIKISPMS
jgi:hypothetical protein